MQTRTLKSDSLLLVAAFIWGTTFVAQRKGMDHIGPMTYIVLRFLLGAVTLVPLILWRRNGVTKNPGYTKRFLLWGGALGGLALFGGTSFQQMGLQYTTAGKAGFVTSLYVVLVPLMGLVLGHRCGRSLWIGVGLAVTGLYLLSVTESFTIARGDLLVLVGAFFWALHVQVIGYLAQRAAPLRIACVQFIVCAALALPFAFVTEKMDVSAIRDAAIPILYGGVLSAGIAFTLQVVCQRTSPPSHAAIIMSLETVFAALAGWLVLGERLGLRGLIGCVLMLTGLMVVQLPPLLGPRLDSRETAGHGAKMGGEPPYHDPLG
ncbi:MAG: DMT family transporter [Phycisphaerales bacterium]|nr:MAG: DMT family transporter [Phycisphaerales bacterium]